MKEEAKANERKKNDAASDGGSEILRSRVTDLQEEKSRLTAELEAEKRITRAQSEAAAIAAQQEQKQDDVPKHKIQEIMDWVIKAQKKVREEALAELRVKMENEQR